MMAIYAADAQELLPGSLAGVGRDAIRAFYQQLLQQLPRFAHHFEPDTIMLAESGDLAVVRGSYRFTPDTLQPGEGQVGKFVGVWGRTDGDWRLALNISNSDHPTAG
jgi:ketosteroid isomerase-like protein